MALQEAMKSEMMNRHGCVIALKRRIVSRGHNTMHGCRGATRSCHSCHAEIAALSKLRCKKKGLIMVVVQFNRCFEIKNSTPCPECTRRIRGMTEIRKVFFTSSASTAAATAVGFETIHPAHLVLVPDAETTGVSFSRDCSRRQGGRWRKGGRKEEEERGYVCMLGGEGIGKSFVPR